jgi:hypothetical protein
VSGRIYQLPAECVIRNGDLTIFKDVPMYDSVVLIAEKKMVM